MAWGSLRRNVWSLVKWAVGMAAGTIGFLEIAPRYEQWKASVWSLISGLTPSSAENVWWDIVRIALIIVGVSIISSDILSRIKTRLKPKSLYSGRSELDSRFAHVEGRLFYPWYYFLPLVTKLGLKRDLHHIPRHKLIINHKTQKAFWFGSWSYRLLVPILKIQVASERKRILFSRLDQWCTRENYNLIRRPAIEEDLLEGTDSISLIENQGQIQEVKWHLSGDVQPVPPFGSQDILGSDKASKLHFSQRGKNLTLTGDMRGLKSSYMYHVQLAKPYTPLKLAKDTIIGAEKAPYASFTTDENGRGTWAISMAVNDLTRHGIIDRFVVWVNDAPKNASVLASDIILLKLSLEFEEKKTQTQEIPTPDREKEDFRNGVATEVHSLLKMFVDPLHHWDISYPSWSSKAEQSKAAILGKEGYLVVRALYDAIEERNRYFTWKGGMALAEVDPLNRKCVEAFSRAYSEVTWLKIASDTDSLLSKARKNVGLL